MHISPRGETDIISGFEPDGPSSILGEGTMKSGGQMASRRGESGSWFAFDQLPLLVDVQTGEGLFELGELVLDCRFEVRVLPDPNLLQKVFVAPLHKLQRSLNCMLIESRRWHFYLLS